MIGLGVMGANLALNIEDHGFPVAVWNREPETTEQFCAANPDKPLTATRRRSRSSSARWSGRAGS